jgi:galactose mutarotase-like enzyme
VVAYSTGCFFETRIIEDHVVLHLENEHISIGIDVDQGAHIYQLIDKKTNVDFLYKDPKGLAKHDIGGWYELFPNAGKACRFNDKDIPGHGDVRSAAWSYRIDHESLAEIQLTLEVTSSVLPFKLEKKIGIRKDLPCLFISEKITNLSSETQPYLWGHHVTFGSPFISPECRIDLPECRVYKRHDYGNEATRLAPNASGTIKSMLGKNGSSLDLTYFSSETCSEMLFINELAGHWYNLFNEKLTVGCALSWHGAAFPYLWLWQENRAAQHPPFLGRTVGMALEPQSSNVPILANAHEEKRAPMLQAGQSLESYLTMTVHNNANLVQFVSKEGSLHF